MTELLMLLNNSNNASTSLTLTAKAKKDTKILSVTEEKEMHHITRTIPICYFKNK